ncbi:MAG: GyrI-like domain-containing protein [Fuerstiella sp.]
MPKFEVHRSTVIKASPEKVFEAVSDFGTWTTWSPWLCAEPTAEVTVTDDSSSVGSVYSWTGEVVGAGEIEHRTLKPGQLILDEIRFQKPFKSVSDVSFELEPSGEGTHLTWRMKGSLPFFLFWMRSMMETFIGMDYVRGLRMLKEWLETGQIRSQTHITGIVDAGPLRMAGVRKTCSMKDIGPSMQQACEEASQKFQAAGLPTDGQRISVYHSYDMKAQVVVYTTGLTIADSQLPVPEGLSEWSLPACRAFGVEHIGSYEHLGNGWSAAHQHVRYRKLKQKKIATFEIYKSDPATTPEEELRTDIFLPLR